MNARESLAKTITTVTDGWEGPLDDVHDVPRIVNAILASDWRAEHDRAVLYRLAEHFDRMGEGTDWQDSWEWRAAEEVRDYAARLTEKGDDA